LKTLFIGRTGRTLQNSKTNYLGMTMVIPQDPVISGTEANDDSLGFFDDNSQLIKLKHPE